MRKEGHPRSFLYLHGLEVYPSRQASCYIGKGKPLTENASLELPWKFMSPHQVTKYSQSGIIDTGG